MATKLMSLDALTYEFPQMKGDARLRELILYIADKCADDPKFGATKLNKILFFADFISYMKTGEPVTGAKYMHLDKGAVPQRMKPLREEMIAEGDIHIAQKQIGNFEQHRVIALKPANIDEYFKPRDIALVDEIIKAFWNRGANEVSELSHGMAWKVFKNDKQLIPYEAALLSDEDITANDITRTGELAKEYEW